MFIICIDFLTQKKFPQKIWPKSDLIKKGKIKGQGISQATSEEIERCNAVTPLTCVQNEYSIMKRMYEKEIKTCEKLVILLLLSILWLVDSYLENTTNIQNMKEMMFLELLLDLTK